MKPWPIGLSQPNKACVSRYLVIHQQLKPSSRAPKTVPIGYAMWFRNYSTFLAHSGIYLEDLFVLPEWRGHGIGPALMRRVARIALDRGCARMEWSVLDWNEPAIRFYKSLESDYR